MHMFTHLYYISAYTQKSSVHPQKGPNIRQGTLPYIHTLPILVTAARCSHPQKSSAYPQKSPIYPQMSPLYLCCPY